MQIWHIFTPPNHALIRLRRECLFAGHGIDLYFYHADVFHTFSVFMLATLVFFSEVVVHQYIGGLLFFPRILDNIRLAVADHAFIVCGSIRGIIGI